MTEVVGLDIEELRGDADRLTHDGNVSNNYLNKFVKMPEKNGYVVMRLLPPKKGFKFYQATRIHKINGRTFHCRKELVNGKWVGDCPICNYIKKLYALAEQAEKSGDGVSAKAYKDEARALNAYERYYYNVVVREEKNDDKIEKNILKIFSCGKKIQAKILRSIFGDEETQEPGLGNIADLKTGRDFKVIKKMVKGVDGEYANYDESKFLEPSPAGEPEAITKWIESMDNLSELRSVKEFNELEKQIAIHRGIIKDESTGFDIEELDKKYSGASSKTLDDVVTSVDSSPVSQSVAQSVQQPKVDLNVEDVELGMDEEEFMKELQKAGEEFAS